MPRQTGNQGAPAPPPKKQRPVPVAPPPVSPPPPGWVSTRAAAIHPMLAQNYPDLGFSFLRSGLGDAELHAVTSGVWKLIESGSLSPLKNTQMAVPLSAPAPVSQAAVAQTVGAIHLDAVPSEVQARVGGLTPDMRPIGQWLVQENARGGGLLFHRTRPLSKEADPHSLSDLVLYTRTSGNDTLVVLRSVVQEFLQTGLRGTPGGPIVPQEQVNKLAKPATPGFGDTLPTSGPELITGATVLPAHVANPNDPNYLRAVALLKLIAQVYPHANIEYQSGGLLGEANTQITGFSNDVLGPLISRGLGPRRHIRNFGLDANGKLVETTPTTPIPSLSESFNVARTTTNLSYGKIAAQVGGIKPTDPGYGAFTNGFNFIVDWYTNPLVVAGKVGEGLKLAATVPIEFGAGDASGIAGMIYKARAKSVEDLITSTPAGNRLTKSISAAIVNNPKSAAEYLTRTHGFTPAQAAIMATARNPVEAADLLINHFKGLDEVSVDTLLGRNRTIAEEIGRLQKVRDTPRPEGVFKDSRDVTDAVGDRIASLNAEKLANDAKLRFNPAEANYDPLRVLPRMKASSALMKGAADTLGPRWGKWFQDHILDPSDIQFIPGTRVNLKRLFAPIVKEGHPYTAPFSPSAVRGDFESLHTGLEAWMIDHGVPATERARALEHYTTATNSQEVYNAIINEIVPTIADHSKAPPAEVRNELTLWSKTYSDESWGLHNKPGTLRGGTAVPEHEPLFGTHSFGPDGQVEITPQPWLRDHLVHRFYLPGHERTLDLTSAFRRFIRKVPLGPSGRITNGTKEALAQVQKDISEATSAAEKNVLYAKLDDLTQQAAAERQRNVNLLDAWHAWLRIEDQVTRVWKNAILLGRAPAVFLRTAGEESVRAAAAGLASPVNNPLTWLRNTLETKYRMADVQGIADETRMANATALVQQEMDLPIYALRQRYKIRQEFNREYGAELTPQLGSIHNFNLADAVRAPDKGRAIELSKYPDEGYEALRGHHYQWSQDQMMREVLKSSSTETMMKWARTPQGEDYITDMHRVWNKFDDVPKAVTDAEANPEVTKIGGVSEERLNWVFDSIRTHTDQLTGGSSEVKSAILNHGFYVQRPAQVREALGQLAQARQKYREYEQFSDAARTEIPGPTRDELFTNSDLAREESFRLEADAKSVLDASGISSRELARMADDPEALAKFAEKRDWIPITTRDYATELRGRADTGEFTPPAFVSGKVFDAPDAASASEKRRISNWMYQHFLSGPEQAVIRKPIMRELYQRRLEELKGLGWKEADAARAASRYAYDEARQLMYDLGERTSAQHWARHLAPFFPAWQEILTTWAWKLPAKYYQGVGQAFLLTRANQILDLMKNMGIDPNKPQSFGPFSALLHSALGGPGFTTTYNPKSFNLVSQSFLPGLGPIPEVGLSLLAKKFPLIGDARLTHWLLPYGADVQLGSVSVNRIYEGFMHRPPWWEVASLETQDVQYAFAKMDAIRLARVQLADKGEKPPGLNSTPAQQASYAQDLLDKSNHNLTVLFLWRGLASAVFPAPLHVTDNYKRDISAFYNEVSHYASGSPEATAAWDRWLVDHPYGDFYRTPSTVPTRQIPQQKFAKYSDSYQRVVAEIDQGYRKTLAPEDFIAVGQYLSSRTVLNNQIQHALDDIGGTAPKLLTNWWQRSEVLGQAAAGWNRYLATPDGKTGDAIWKNLIGAKHPEQFVSYSEGLDAMSRFYQAGREILTHDSPYQVSRSDLRTVLGQMGAAIAQAAHSPGVGTAAKGIDWWFNNVYSPYSEHLYGAKGLYAQADQWKQLESPERPDAYVKFSHVMEQIREVKANAAHQVGPDGQKYPTPEEFQWGNLPAVAKGNEDSQEKKVTDWLTLKPEWLTPFALKKVGLGGTPKQNELSSYIANYDAALSTYISRHNIYPSSHDYENLQTQRQNDLAKKAAQLGPSAVRLWKASNETAAERMLTTGWAEPNSRFGWSVGLASQIKSQITAKGYSPKGSSQLALSLKNKAYSIFDSWYKGNAAYHSDINMIQSVLGKDPDHPAGRYAVYNAIYFDDFGGL